MYNEIDIQVKLAQMREMQSDAEWERIVNEAWRAYPRRRSQLLNHVLAGLGRNLIHMGSYLEERYRECTLNSGLQERGEVRSA